MNKVPEIQINVHTPDENAAKAWAAIFGLPFESISVEAEAIINQKRIERMRKLGMREARPGRGDTGSQLWGQSGLANVTVEDFIGDLTAAGYQLVEAFYKKTPLRKNDQVVPGKFKWVLRFAFSIEKDEKPLPAEMTATLGDFLKGKVWGMAHVWENDTSDTVNLTGGLQPSTCRKFRQLRLAQRDEQDYENRQEQNVEIRGNFRFELITLPKATAA